MSRPFNWKVFFILWAAAIFGMLAVQPYVRGLTAAGGHPQAPTPPLEYGIGVLQWGLYVLVGLWLAGRIGLGLPILAAALRREPVGDKLRAMLPISIVLGVVIALLVVGLDKFVFQPVMLRELGEQAMAVFAAAVQQPAWKGFLASFSGGINEEILLRLVFMSLLAWLGHFVSKTPDGRPTLTALWIAIVLAAVVFALLHLPVTATVVPLTPVVVARGLLLNSMLAIAYGWLYMKHGLEGAMTAHFSTDLILHVVFSI
jgi:membrane protease YdiL (CAAX protease family)